MWTWLGFPGADSRAGTYVGGFVSNCSETFNWLFVSTPTNFHHSPTDTLWRRNNNRWISCGPFGSGVILRRGNTQISWWLWLWLEECSWNGTPSGFAQESPHNWRWMLWLPNRREWALPQMKRYQDFEASLDHFVAQTVTGIHRSVESCVMTEV